MKARFAQTVVSLVRHGLGVALYEYPMISRLHSLEHPVEIEEGMVFALETYCPARDGRYDEQPIRTNWQGGLQQLWKQPAGGGYSSFSVADGVACERRYETRAPQRFHGGASPIVAQTPVPISTWLCRNSWVTRPPRRSSRSTRRSPRSSAPPARW